MSNDTFFVSSNKDKSNNNKRKRNNLLMPLAFVLIIVPLIIHEYIFSPQITNEAWFPDANILSDYFMFYKGMALTAIGFLLVVILLFKQFASKQKPFSNWQVWQFPLVIYVGFVIISSLVSPYSSISWNGSYEQFETALVLLAYCILTFYAYYVIKSEQDIQYIIRCLYIGISIMTVLGLLQLVGLDPITSTVGKYIISADKSKEAIDAMQMNFEHNRVYLTLFNPNYVGVYASLLFPITLGLAIMVKDKKNKIISLILSILLAISVFGSQSKTGLVILLGTLVLVVLVLHRKIFANKMIIIAMCTAVIILIAGFFAVNAMQDNAYLNSIKNALTQTNTTTTLQSITTKNDYVEIVYKNQTLYLRCELNSENKIDFSITDKEGTTFKCNYDDATMTFTIADDTLNTISAKPIFLSQDGIFGCELVIENYTWYIKSKTDTEGYSYMNKYGKFDQLVTPASFGFENQGSLFTGRGYLWSRTLPLIKDNIFVGQGPNTFVYAFPQNDYVGKYNNNFDSQVVTKPHNLYLQMSIETGLVSCLAFIALCLIFIMQCIKTYRKSNLETLTEQIGALSAISVVGYMVSGLINDSNIGVAPIFWILIGLGFACNRIVKLDKERKLRLTKMDK